MPALAFCRHLAVLLIAGTLWQSASAAPGGYDPLGVAPTSRVRTIDLTVDDTAHQRQLPLRIYLPTTTTAAPVVIYSHGLGGSKDGNAYLGQHWAGRGYAVVYLQHPGSDAAVWQDQESSGRMLALRKAASARNFMLRIKDVPALIDQLAVWNSTAGHPLAGRLDMTRIGMSGHSFGALTTQAVSGETFLGGRYPTTDQRIKAAIAFSPSSPRAGSAEAAFGTVAIPWMLMTGTRDTSPIGNLDVASRLAVFPALPNGGKYELVLDGAEHSAFGDRALPGDKNQRNPNHHRAILALSTAFWDAWLRQDSAASAWLDGDGPASVLQTKDRWQRK